MLGLTNYLTEQTWEDTLIATYVLVADRLDQAAQTAKFVRTRGPAPGYDDAQVITIALVADYGFDGDEEKALHFLRQYHPTLWSNGIPDTSRFNVRRRELLRVIEALRCQFRDEWRKLRRATPPKSSEASDPALEERIRLVDSVPVILTSRGRGGRTPTHHRDRTSGGMVRRLHATVDLDQMLDEWVLAPGSYPDPKVFPALCDGYVGLIYIGDKGYVGEDQENFVWERGKHLLLPLRRDNQQAQWPDRVQKILGKLRHRIETVFSVMTTAFNLRLPHGRSFTGFVARTATKMLAYTISFFLAQLFMI
jgi:hypothetical protein